MRSKKFFSSFHKRRLVRRLLVETLEDRRPLNVDWRNPLDQLDVDRDRGISPLDVLTVINEINRGGNSQFPPVRPETAPFLDVDGDGGLSPLDALRVINALNSGVQSPRQLAEGGTLASEQSIVITTGQSQGSREIQLQISPEWDATAPNSLLQDRLNVYVTAPDSMTTLLDRGRLGTSVFSLTKDRVETAPGISSWDGRILSIDLTPLTASNTAEIRLQLLSQLASSGTRIAVLPVSNRVDPEGSVERLALAPSVPELAGPATEISSWSPTSQVEIVTENWRYDATTRRLQLDARLFNFGPAIGRDSALVLSNLSSGITGINASGTTSSGAPYWNLRPSIPRGGLGTQQRSELFTIELANAPNARFPLVASIVSGAANRAPSLAPVSPIDVMPGSTVEIALQATDPDGDSIQFTTVGGTPLPKLSLSTDGLLVIQPTPEQLGTYQLTIQSSDGTLNDRETITVRVLPDPVGTTRVSGRILNVDGSPIAGLRIEVGAVSGLTAADGSFLLNLGTGVPASETLRVRGELLTGPVKYPFIAEKLPFMLQHEIYSGYNNVIVRPIYLPTLNEGTSIDPVKDTRVERLLRSDEAPVAVDVGANTLFTQQGLPFTGSLSITEVPPSRTPASLPGPLFPNLVVTIQPGEMVFATPTPVTFPNRLNYPPGTILDLWSINPVTGEFDDVGDMRVSQDGKSIETIHGGIRNSSWHMPALPPANPGNLSPGNHGSNPDPDGSTPCGGGSGIPPEALLGPNKFPVNLGVASTSMTCLYTGALKEFHSTVTYNSLGEDRGVEFAYSSLRANANPIIHFGINNVNVGEDQRIGARVSVFHHGTSLTVGDSSSNLLWRIPTSPLGAPQVNVSMAVQAEMSALPTGIYGYSVMYGPGQWANDSFSGTLFQTSAPLVHVNSKNSPYGAGWGISGLQQLIENADESVLLVDGGLYELLFRRDPVVVDRYRSPRADFSELTRTDSGWQRRLPDGTIYRFRSSDGRLIDVVDRWGNKTLYAYNADGSLDSMTDPVGLVTRFEYNIGKLTRLVDPVGRITRFEHDSAGNLTRVIDPDNTTRTWSYDPRNLMTGEVDARGNRELSYYDEYGRVSGATRKDGSEWKFRPAAVYGLNSIEKLADENNPPFAVLSDVGSAILIDGRGEITNYQSDRSGQLVRSRDRLGLGGVFVKDADDLIREVKDARGFSTWYQYDDRGNIVKVHDEINSPSSWYRDPILRLGLDTNRGSQEITSSIHSSDFNGDGIDDFVIGHSNLADSIIFGNESGGFSEPLFLSAPVNGGAGTDVLCSAEESIPQDVDNDGDIDIVHVTCVGLTTRINQGDDNFSFSSSSGKLPAADFGKQSQFADLNKDGFVDLVRSIGDTVRTIDGITQGYLTWQVFLGNGDGTFREGQVVEDTVPATGFRSNISLVDWNHDEQLDLVMMSPNGSFNEIFFVVREGAGDGTFAAPAFIPTPIDRQRSLTSGFVVSDMNQDGLLDILLADDWIMLNTGNDQFLVKDISEDRSRLANEFGARDTLGDFDADGDIDIARVSGRSVSGYRQLQVLRNDGNFSFTRLASQALPIFPYENSPSSFSLSKNLETKPSMLVLATTGVALIDLFPSPSTMSQIDFDDRLTDGFRFDNFDEDDSPDLLFWGQDQSDPLGKYGLWLQRSTAPQQWSATETLLAQFVKSLRIVDWNRDGRKDIIVNAYTNIDSNPFVEQLLYLENRVEGFVAADSVTFSTTQVIEGFELGDVDGDGLDDVVVANGNQQNTQYVRNRNGRFESPISLPFSVNGIRLFDVNQDGRKDLVYPNYQQRTLAYRPNDPVRIFGTEVLMGIFATPLFDGGDVNGDGFTDIVSTQSIGSLPPFHSIALGGSNGFSLQPALDFGGAGFNRPQLLDADSDGDLDLVSFVRELSAYRVYANDGRGSFSTPLQFTIGSFLTGTAETEQLFDLNNDGFLDLAYLERRDASSIAVRFNQLTDSGKRFEYEPTFNRVTKFTDDLGRITLYQIDPANGSEISITEVVGDLGGSDDRTTNYSYTVRGQVASKTDPVGVVTKYQYDGLGRLISMTEAFGLPESAETIFAYDTAGNRVQSIDPLGRITRYKYDTANRLIETEQPDPDGPGPFASPISRNEYDPNGNLVHAIDPLNRSIRYTYDALNRNTATQNEMLQISQKRYDFAGNVVSTTDGLGKQINFSYDTRNRLIASTDALGNTTRFLYSAANQLTSVVDSMGRKTGYVYDSRGRQTGRIDGNGKRLTTIYDAADQIISTIDELGQTTKYDYSRFGELIQRVDALGGISRAEFDAVGNRISLTDPVNNKTTFTYDAFNRLTRETNPFGKSLAWKYDAVGNLTETIDRNGRKRLYRYDELNRRIQERWLDGSEATIREIVWAYDAVGQMLSARDPDSQWSFAYDTLGRLTSADSQGTPISPRVQFTYGYDANDNPTSRVDRIAGIQVGSIARTFDNQNRLASIRQNTGGTVTRRVDFEYDRSGLFQSLTRYRDSTGQQQVARTTYRYDAAARVEQINHAAIDRVLATYDYTRDAAGRITRIMSPDGTADFSYDAAGQLISANHSAQEDEFYSYDLNGNRTMTGYRTGLNNRLESDGRYNYFYDDNGNRTLRVEIATGQRTEYLWDHRNRLASVVLKNSLGLVQSEILYTYDVFDRRIRKSIDADGPGAGLTTIKQYAHDGRHIAYELDGVGNITHRLLHGPVTDMVLADQTADGVVHWMLSDHLGTVRDIINNAGIITNHIRYNSFGNIQSQTNTALTPNFAFTGREWDAETGLYQYRARYYDATVGQFASEDPLGLADDLNMARYVRNDPIRRLDPSGTQSDCSENLSQNTNPPGPLPVPSSDFYPRDFPPGHGTPFFEIGPDGLIRTKFDPPTPPNNTTGCPDDNCDGRLG